MAVAVCPQDKEIIESYIKKLGGAMTHRLSMLRSDPDLQEGVLVLESDDGRINSGFLATLDEIGSILMDQAENPAIQACIPGEGQDGG